jgi:hypothetical protein
MITISPQYPTEAHRLASIALVDFFSRSPIVRSIILTCSCARGKATKDSCIDISILTDKSADPGQLTELINKWDTFYQSEGTFRTLQSTGKYSNIDLDFTNGLLSENPNEHNWTSGPDSFELSIGNLFIYSYPLYGNDYWDNLRNNWIPYYSDSLRLRRLKQTFAFMNNNLEHIPLYTERTLYFQCLKRLYHAFAEFLQALFISKRTYPISYDKHIKEQLVDILKLPELYIELTHILEIQTLESDQIAKNAKALRSLSNEYIEE